ncbi:hypothetical protein L210DRAFT_3565497 [Boletus edulis BED1]|uniref:Uncharacterized protein n=1 Tax=Boletus edulis BED1 TaxID=1328754 RepID=A0AAD4G8A3_BOLED|nr:hypothetical protein L210DRAFT_3565497 [Boletus edulis BED1]
MSPHRLFARVLYREAGINIARAHGCPLPARSRHAGSPSTPTRGELRALVNA